MPVGRATYSGAFSAARAGTVQPTLRIPRLLTLRPMEWGLWGMVACNGALIRVHQAGTGVQVGCRAGGMHAGALSSGRAGTVRPTLHKPLLSRRDPWSGVPRGVIALVDTHRRVRRTGGPG